MTMSILSSGPAPANPPRASMASIVPLDQVRSIEELYFNPLEYERTAFMDHIRRYDREALRTHYLSQPVAGAPVWANYAVNLWEYEHGIEELTSHPWNITIPMTEVCNATCAFCSSPLVPKPKTLAVHEVQHFADALRYAIRVSLQGLGEPLAHPHFEEIVEEVRKYQNPVAQLEIITNGWLLSGHRWELLKSLRLGDIQVSVNAANDRTHQIAMGSRPGTFDQVVKNIDQLLADRAWEGNLKVSMVITRHSLAEVPQLLDLFVPKGVEIFQFNPLLPLTTPDWGFGRTDQYLELWCGHLPDAPELVAAAAAAIEKYRREKIVITATPEQWLLPVTPPMQSDLIQISTTRQKAAAQTGTAVERPEWERLFVQMDDDRVVLESHDRHTRVGVDQDGGVRFGGTDQSCRWAYLLRTPHLQLAAGEHALDLHVDVESGQLYGGILDIEKDDFIVQQELGPGTTRISFTLAEPRVIDVVVRQGPDDGHVSAVYRSGRLSAGTGSLSQLAGEPVAADANEDPPSPPVVLSSETPALEAPAAMSAQPTAAPAAAPPVESEGAGGHTVSKASRVYCPMVYTTLSVFHHSLDVSICCYMENAPGNRQPSLKQMPLLQAYNDDGFRLVRRTLNTDRHIPVCESCPYGASRT